jgi:hypothetical protein
MTPSASGSTGPHANQKGKEPAQTVPDLLFVQATVLVQPGDRALNHPALGA